MEGDHNDRNSSERETIRALVVDDNVVNRKIHQTLLTNVGVRKLEVVTNGKEAIDIHSSGHSFDLILMDLDMPIMNGIEATRRLRSMGVQSKIAGVSARSAEAQIQEFIEAGLDHYYEKPLTIAKLTAVLDDINPN